MDALLIWIVVVASLLCQPQQQCYAENWYDMALKEYPNLADVIGPPKVHLRVIGGDATTNEKLGGYLTALFYMGDFICGGTLVDPRIVVSAAHCFEGRINKDDWVVAAGITSLNETGVRSKLQEFVTPAVFRETNMHMDVSVLLLEEPVVGPGIQTIPLCNTTLSDGLQLSVSGWGLINPVASTPHQSIRTAVVPIIKKSKCRQAYKRSIAITDSMFCAGALGERDACTFDSGGPFVYKRKDNVTELCGIVSFGISCASHKYPGVYTDVNYVRPFVEQTIAYFKTM